jgi:hypothetical protein
MTHPLAILVGKITTSHDEFPWSEKRPLNEAAQAVVRASLADSRALREKRAQLSVQAQALFEEVQQVDAAIEAARRKFFGALEAAQPELASQCLQINDDDMTYQTHDHGPKPEGPKPPPWVDEYLNPKKGNGNG